MVGKHSTIEQAIGTTQKSLHLWKRRPGHNYSEAGCGDACHPHIRECVRGGCRLNLDWTSARLCLSESRKEASQVRSRSVSLKYTYEVCCCYIQMLLSPGLLGL